jgi:hypothetical protein
MRKLFLILTIVCLLVTLTILNAIPVSAGTLTITPPVGGPNAPEDPPGQVKPPPGQEEPPGPVMTPIVVEIPERAGEDLSGVAERNPILEYVGDPQSHPGPEL